MQALHHRVDGAVPERKDKVGDAPPGVNAEDEDELCCVMCVCVVERMGLVESERGRVLNCLLLVCVSVQVKKRHRAYTPQHTVSEQKRSIVPHRTWRQSITTMITMVITKICRQLTPIRQKR